MFSAFRYVVLGCTIAATFTTLGCKGDKKKSESDQVVPDDTTPDDTTPDDDTDTDQGGFTIAGSFALSSALVQGGSPGALTLRQSRPHHQALEHTPTGGECTLFDDAGNELASAPVDAEGNFEFTFVDDPDVDGDEPPDEGSTVHERCCGLADDGTEICVTRSFEIREGADGPAEPDPEDNLVNPDSDAATRLACGGLDADGVPLEADCGSEADVSQDLIEHLGGSEAGTDDDGTGSDGGSADDAGDGDDAGSSGRDTVDTALMCYAKCLAALNDGDEGAEADMECLRTPDDCSDEDLTRIAAECAAETECNVDAESIEHHATSLDTVEAAVERIEEVGGDERTPEESAEAAVAACTDHTAEEVRTAVATDETIDGLHGIFDGCRDNITSAADFPLAASILGPKVLFAYSSNSDAQLVVPAFLCALLDLMQAGEADLARALAALLETNAEEAAFWACLVNDGTVSNGRIANFIHLVRAGLGSGALDPDPGSGVLTNYDEIGDLCANDQLDLDTDWSATVLTEEVEGRFGQSTMEVDPASCESATVVFCGGFNPVPTSTCACDDDCDARGDCCEDKVRVCGGVHAARFLVRYGVDLGDVSIDMTGFDPTGDFDGDGVTDGEDNCFWAHNPDQGEGDDNPCADTDQDGTANHLDNCVASDNADQRDTDRDGQGDACDEDDDGDYIADGDDNCPIVSNYWENVDGDGDGKADGDPDGDGVGAKCDCATETDGDTVCDNFDNCPEVDNADQIDRDGDTVGDACDNDLDGDGVKNLSDNCPDWSNPGQDDTDGDDLGDICDPENGKDSDWDWINDEFDNCPGVSWNSTVDSDGDGKGDGCDSDAEGDGICDYCYIYDFEASVCADEIPEDWKCKYSESLPDNCPEAANNDQADDNENGRGDECEKDADEDGVIDAKDNCPDVQWYGTEDLDGDGKGDGCDDDWDNDGWNNEGDDADNCPWHKNQDQKDSNDNGVGDVCDFWSVDYQSDYDGDGTPDLYDICPKTPDGWRESPCQPHPNRDMDLLGDFCDSDADGDGIVDDCEVDDNGECVGDPPTGTTFNSAGKADNCPSLFNDTQAASDCSFVDIDGDSVPDDKDKCPGVYNCGYDPDGDGIDYACDKDADNDNVNDDEDNCPGTYNPNQENTDDKGGGDACECADSDGDGWCDEWDNCPKDFNTDQFNNDADKDTDGDICDDDDDNDGVDDSEDDFPYCAENDATQCANDFDRDGASDDVDNCPPPDDNYKYSWQPPYFNPDQSDVDKDGTGDSCDPDRDNDTIADVDDDGQRLDNCPEVSNKSQADADEDGVGDACDLNDDDGDGFANEDDNCPHNWNGDQLDKDEDGQGDWCDEDVDGDGAVNYDDTCWWVANAQGDDDDGDGLGDDCDPDSDWDGIRDDKDNCSDAPNPQQQDSNGNGKGDACDDDWDGDGVGDNWTEQADGTWKPGDNCPRVANADQADKNNNLIGDACDAPDSDDDLVPDTVEFEPGKTSKFDNCQLTPNPDQLESEIDGEKDGVGNACDKDADGDGICNVLDEGVQAEDDATCTLNDGKPDNCPLHKNADQADSADNPDDDADATTGDACEGADSETTPDRVLDKDDNCPNDFNPGQENSDSDPDGDACDPDDDNDKVLDSQDNCPATPNPGQEDGDEDGIGDLCECADKDVDGACDDWADNCVGVANEDQTADRDGDGVGDRCDGDQDGDGICNELELPSGVAPNQCTIRDDMGQCVEDCKKFDGTAYDNCPLSPNASQSDNDGFEDGDGKGDECEADRDGDGVKDAKDNCVARANPDQTDIDDDGAGRGCDADDDGDGICDWCTDAEGDGACDEQAGCAYVQGKADVCPFENDATQDPSKCVDDDADGVTDTNDNCPPVADEYTYNPDQLDGDNDGAGDGCDADSDNDTYCDFCAGRAKNPDDSCSKTAPAGCTYGPGGMVDNCPNTPNDQTNSDATPEGDACQDFEPDGVFDSEDNCLLEDGGESYNPEQLDNDADTLGDECDPDDDGDTICDPYLDVTRYPGGVTCTIPQGSMGDNCPFDANQDQADSEVDDQGQPMPDGVGDVCDNCLAVPNPDQWDRNRNGTGDACDDDDSDGVVDANDNCWQDENPAGVDGMQTDTDGDYVGDACDNCVDKYNYEQTETGGDPALGDHCDDRDGDGTVDAYDNCPDTANADQADANEVEDGWGAGDACE